jgi:hypothetical protein
MSEREASSADPSRTRNPYQLERDEELETFARGVIDVAMGKTATSPRQFAYYSTQAAKQIAQYVLERFTRKKG